MTGHEGFTIEEATATDAGHIRGVILDTIATRVGQVADVHPRLLEGIEVAARKLDEEFARELDSRSREAVTYELRERGIDPKPETTGTAYRHAVHLRGRVCLQRTDGSWWPLRYETGHPNLSGSTVCLAGHPVAP